MCVIDYSDLNPDDIVSICHKGAFDGPPHATKINHMIQWRKYSKTNECPAGCKANTVYQGALKDYKNMEGTKTNRRNKQNETSSTKHNT